MARPTYKFLLFDFPSDHEVEERLATETDVLHALITNAERGKELKTIRIATPATLKASPATSYSPEIVQLSGHADRNELWMLGGKVRWQAVAQLLIQYVAPLKSGETRLLLLSCCESRHGFFKIRKTIRSHYSHAVVFAGDSIDFDESMVFWPMFYFGWLRKRPLPELITSINQFANALRMELLSTEAKAQVPDQG
jgi:hypothetical protein